MQSKSSSHSYLQSIGHDHTLSPRYGSQKPLPHWLSMQFSMHMPSRQSQWPPQSRIQGRSMQSKSPLHSLSAQSMVQDCEDSPAHTSQNPSPQYTKSQTSRHSPLIQSQFPGQSTIHSSPTQSTSYLHCAIADEETAHTTATNANVTMLLFLMALLLFVCPTRMKPKCLSEGICR